MTASNTVYEVQGEPHSFAPLLDRGFDRPQFLQGLKTLVAAANERIRREHDVGARGRNVVRHLTALVDDVVRTVFQYVAKNYAGPVEPCALLALGGYGRGEMNPYSDIDLMFLCHKTPPEEVVRETLYLLWDVGYTLGHSVRTRRDVIKMADADLTAQTAMREARFLEGDYQLYRWFEEEIHHKRFSPRRRRSFVRRKLAECRERHATFSNTVNLMEPNVKESPGGLRDYHTARWIAEAFYRAETLTDLENEGLLTPEDQWAVEAALDFLFRVRNALHYLYGRKNDLLSVDVQETLAAALHFEAADEKLAVEYFLKAYYVHANVIAHFCETIVEAVSRMYRPRRWSILRRTRRVGDGFVVRDGYLGHEAAALDEAFAARPALMMQTFVKAHDRQVPLEPVLSRAIKAHASLCADEAARYSSEVRTTFWHVLSQPHAAPVLRALHWHGLLNAYIPEFAALTCLPSYDLHHCYTVDEHTLLTVEKLESLEGTIVPMLRPLARLYEETSEADKKLLKLALLLHDLGKDEGPGKASHVHRSGELAEQVCERLELPAEQRHAIQLLVVHHLAMNRLAQRRDITDKKVIAECASLVETPSSLQQLYLLTFADTSAVGPDVWSVWKGTLLAELYHRTHAYLVQQRPVIAPSDDELRSRARAGLMAVLNGQGSSDDVDHFLAAMPPRYLMATAPSQMAVHLRMTKEARQLPVVLHAEQHASAGFSSVTICAKERRGIFSLIAGALSRSRLNILGAEIYTSQDGLALDILHVETLAQGAVADLQVWQRVEAVLRDALLDARHVEQVPLQGRHPLRTPKSDVFVKPPHIVMTNSHSDTHTILELQAQDSLGLLYRLTRVLYEQDVDIALAKISTEGNRAIDVFYVTDADGQKIVEEAALESIRQALLAAVV
jgi:[protein-PII] uridylyltransferase